VAGGDESSESPPPQVSACPSGHRLWIAAALRRVTPSRDLPDGTSDEKAGRDRQSERQTCPSVGDPPIHLGPPRADPT